VVAFRHLHRIVDRNQERWILLADYKGPIAHPAIYEQRDSAKYWAHRKVEAAPSAADAAAWSGHSELNEATGRREHVALREKAAHPAGG
jgi:hypothetical protein